MKLYRLNNQQGDQWSWYADSKKQATELYITQCHGVETLKEFKDYCKELNINHKIEWTVENE